jgi:hypothetical protein
LQKLGKGADHTEVYKVLNSKWVFSLNKQC